MLVPFHGARRVGTEMIRGPGMRGTGKGSAALCPGWGDGAEPARQPSGGSLYRGSPPCSRAASPALALTAGGSQLSGPAQDRSARDARPGR